MRFSNLRLLPFLGVLCFFPLPAAAGPSPGTVPPGSTSNNPNPTTPVNEYQGLGIDRYSATYLGTVYGVDDRPIPDVQVQLFVDGTLVASALSDGSGDYRLKATFDQRQDRTVLLWFVAPDPSLVPKEIVLAESAVSRKMGLISPCVARATVVSGRQFRVYLFTATDRDKELFELDCLP
jgi:hypothetical protein